MLQNSIKRKLREGKAVVGTLLNLGDPIAAEAIGRFPVAPRARIPWNNEENIKRVLGILGDLRFMTAAARAARDAIKVERGS